MILLVTSQITLTCLPHIVYQVNNKGSEHRASEPFSYLFSGRGDTIRTCDLLNSIRVLTSIFQNVDGIASQTNISARSE